MNEQLRQAALNEAIRIGDELISKADNTGLLWNTMYVHSSQISWEKTVDLYAGNSGIILFLAELYNITQNKKYIDTAVRGMREVEGHNDEVASNKNSFYNGQMGVSFTMLRLFQLTGNKIHLKKAKDIAKKCIKDRNKSTVNDLLTGTAGTLLALLHLYAMKAEKWILGEIILLSRDLLTKAHPGKKGIYWDRSNELIRGLCGFSHGTAGIGFVFLELGNYFNNKAFYKIAEQAFDYENFYWDKQLKNWPQFRKSRIKTEEKKIENAYLEKNWDFFHNPKDLNYWCHGAAGIGLSRLRAWELLKKKEYKRDLKRAIAKTVKTDIKDLQAERLGYTLCHASGGNAELFIQAFQTLHDPKFQNLASTIVRNLLAYKKEEGFYQNGHQILYHANEREILEDNSLFLGNAGIGYFLLRAIAPNKVPSILAPVLAKKSKQKLPAVTLSYINKTLLEKQYPRTIFLLENLLNKELSGFLKKEDAFSNKKSLQHFIVKHTRKMKPAYLNNLKDAFGLEKRKIRMKNSNTSHALLAYREEYETKKISEVLLKDDAFFLKEILILNPACTLTFTKWDWQLTSKEKWIKNLTLEPQQHGILLRESALVMQEEYISQSLYFLLDAFKKASSVEQVIKQLTLQFDASSGKEQQFIEKQLMGRAKQAARQAILIISR